MPGYEDRRSGSNASTFDRGRSESGRFCVGGEGTAESEAAQAESEVKKAEEAFCQDLF